MWANVHVYWRLLRDCLKAPGITNKFKILFKPPGWLPEGIESSCKLRQQRVDLSTRFDPAISGFNRLYTFIQFLLSVALSLYLIINAGTIGYAVTSFYVFLLAFSFYVHGTWLEARSYAALLEVLRLAILIGSLLLSDFNAVLSGTLLLSAAISLICVLLIGRNNIAVVSTTPS